MLMNNLDETRRKATIPQPNSTESDLTFREFLPDDASQHQPHLLLIIIGLLAEAEGNIVT